MPIERSECLTNVVFTPMGKHGVCLLARVVYSGQVQILRGEEELVVVHALILRNLISQSHTQQISHLHQLLVAFLLSAALVGLLVVLLRQTLVLLFVWSVLIFSL